jgi:hypothetical protein
MPNGTVAGAVFWVEVLRGPDLLPSAVGFTLRGEDFPGHAAKAALPFEAPRMAGLNPHVVILTRPTEFGGAVLLCCQLD